MGPTTAVTESMQRITTTKLQALAAQHATYERTKAQILHEADNELLASGRVTALLDGMEEHKLPPPPKFSVETMRAFLEQSKNDPSVSPALLDSWENELRNALSVPTRKYEHAALFGRLATEWLESGKTAESSEESEDSFEPVGRKEMHEQRAEWENLVFNPSAEPDTGRIETYLTDLFGLTTESQSSLKQLKLLVDKFEVGHMSVQDVKDTVSNLLKADLLNPEKQAGLKDLRDNPLVLAEIADVLNMQIDSLRTWSWGDAVPLELRRALNGKYRVFMDEDLLTAILLEYVGGKWAVFIKERLVQFMNDAWKKPQSATPTPSYYATTSISQNHKAARSAVASSVAGKRWQTYRDEYFMQQLPDDFAAGSPGYGDDDASAPVRKNFAQKKQDLFHLMIAESQVTSQLIGSWTILQSDFRWFGPSLPHPTILTVMKFFGANKTWLSFFQKYLTPPLRFVHDGPNARTVTRKCGVPISHTLTEVMGELILFCLDFAVNRRSGRNLYRVHDDIWFWGSEASANTAWNTLLEFTDVMGMKLNEEKTGSSTTGGSNTPAVKNDTYTVKLPPSYSQPLPQTPVKWGFLELNSGTNDWTMDTGKVEEHIAELKLQLGATTSILAWIQAWNTYMFRFLSANFGEPSMCLGRDHIDAVIKMFTHIQESLFAPSTSSKSKGRKAAKVEEARNVTIYLKSRLRDQFGLTDPIPDGLLYFPLELGGLGLRNPLIPLLLLRKNAPENPNTLIDDAFVNDEIEYNTLKQQHEAGVNTTQIQQLTDYVTGQFISWQDYKAASETASFRLGTAYEKLMEKPREMDVEFEREVAGVIEEDQRGSKRGASGRGRGVGIVRGRGRKARGNVDRAEKQPKWVTEGYWRWIVQLYGPEIIKEFGGLGLGEKKLLPVGLTKMLGEQRVRWQG